MSKRVVLGGTFNVIHKGHLALLKKAFESGEYIFIGLTSDEMANRVRDVPVQSYEIREKNLLAAITDIMKGRQFRVEKIDDVYGPAIAGNYDAIVVSEETKKGAEKINDARESAGLKPLKIIKIKMMVADDGGKISARRVMKGEIDKNGNLK